MTGVDNKIREAIGVLLDRAERWAEFHECDEDLCEGFISAEANSTTIDGRKYYGHDECDETRAHNEAIDTVNTWLLDEADPSEIVSVTGIHPRCDICGKAQQPEDDWNGETGNHTACESEQGKDIIR